MAVKSVVLAVCVLVFLGYYGNNEVPGEIEDKYKFYMDVTLSRLVADFSTVGSLLTGTDGRTFLRGVIDTAMMTYPKLTPEVTAENLLLDGVEVRWYRRRGDNSRRQPCLVFIHGGGLIAATPSGYDGFTGELVRRLNITAMSIHYRRVPEHTSPAQLQDCVKATLYILKHAERFGIDVNNVALAGDSSGGTLAGSLALYMRDQHPEHPLRFQALIYPLLQGLNLDLPSYQRNGRRGSPFTQLDKVAGVVASYIHGLDFHYERFVPDILCGRHVEQRHRDKYRDIINASRIPQEYKQSTYKPTTCDRAAEDATAIRVLQAGILDPYNFPLMAPSVEGVAPLFMLTAHSDTLSDDGFLYAQRFREAGIPVTHHHSLSGWHGMVNFPDSTAAATRAVADLTEYMAHMYGIQYHPQVQAAQPSGEADGGLLQTVVLGLFIAFLVLLGVKLCRKSR